MIEMQDLQCQGLTRVLSPYLLPMSIAHLLYAAISCKGTRDCFHVEFIGCCPGYR